MKPVTIHQRRPAETTAGVVGTVVGLLFAILHAYANWTLNPEVQPFVPILIGYIAALVTWLKVRGTTP